MICEKQFHVLLRFSLNINFIKIGYCFVIIRKNYLIFTTINAII